MKTQEKYNNWIDAVWPVPEHVHAGTTTRYSGFSLPPFDNFNLASHVGDDLNTVQKNRDQFRKLLSLPDEPVWLQQNHSNRAVNADRVSPGEIADAAYTNSPGIVLAILTADCIPILVSDDSGSEIAAIHAGWRGLSSGIINNALCFFTVRPDKLVAWIGPHITLKHYEVGEDVKTACIDSLGKCAEKAFIPNDGGRWYADLAMMAVMQLNKYGITGIITSGHCTYENEASFYSYRRDKKTGRMATFIWIDDTAIS